MDDHLLMNDDDPEKRIAELERQQAERQRSAPATGGSLTAEQVRNVAFSKPPVGRRGYNEDEVDAFLDLVEATLQGSTGHALTPEQVRNVAFSKPPIGKRGYNEDEVDAFLDLVERQLSSQPGTYPPSPPAPLPPPPVGRSPGTDVARPPRPGRRIADVLRGVFGSWWLWYVILFALLAGGGAGLRFFGDLIPGWNSPAPDWMGPVVLAMPWVAVVVYLVLRLRSSSRRRHRYWASGGGAGGAGAPGAPGAVVAATAPALAGVTAGAAAVIAAAAADPVAAEAAVVVAGVIDIRKIARRRRGRLDRVNAAVAQLQLPPAVFKTCPWQPRSLIDAGLRQWLRCCAAALRDHEVIGMPSRAVDEAWHGLILCTARYATFCEQAYGEFLHHHPEGGAPQGVRGASDSTGEQLRRTVLAWSLVATPGERCVLWDLDERLGVDEPWGIDLARVDAVQSVVAKSNAGSRSSRHR